MREQSIKSSFFTYYKCILRTMSQIAFKFGSKDNIKFVEIYRKHECLWDSRNPQYKNKGARYAALKLFSNELAIENFGPKDVVIKIKNMRSQYLQEIKKIKSSTDSGASEIYTPKLPWFKLLDSFLRRVSESRHPISNPSGDEYETENNNVSELTQDNKHCTGYSTSADDMQELPLLNTQNESSRRTRKMIKDGTGYISTLDKPDNIEKRDFRQDDDLSAFGKYITSSLRKLNSRNCLLAQDDIQAVLSKYKLHQLMCSEATPSFPVSPVSSSNSHVMPTVKLENGDEKFEMTIFE